MLPEEEQSSQATPVAGNETARVEVEDKYKLTFNQIDKRFVGLEIAVGELNEKLKKVVDQKNVDNVQQKVEDLEDLIMVENVGVIELKKMLEDMQQSFQEPKEMKFSTSPEELGKLTSILVPNLESLILPKIDSKISLIEEKIRNIPSGADVSEFKKTIDSVSNELKDLVDETKKEVKDLKENLQPVDQEVVKKIVSEISDVRTEFGKEVTYLKEKIEGERTTKSDIDLKFLSSRVNVLKDNVDFLLNRKTELDLKIQNLEKILVGMEAKVEDVTSVGSLKEIEKGRKEIDIGNLRELNQRLSILERKMVSFEGETQRPRTEEEVSSFLDKQIDELLDKLISLENRIRTLERTLTSDQTQRPIILE